jgi:hypothetical protein
MEFTPSCWRTQYDDLWLISNNILVAAIVSSEPSVRAWTGCVEYDGMRRGLSAWGAMMTEEKLLGENIEERGEMI